MPWGSSQSLSGFFKQCRPRFLGKDCGGSNSFLDGFLRCFKSSHCPKSTYRRNLFSEGFFANRHALIYIAMALSQDKEKRQWSRIVAAGLCPGISDFQTYEKLALLQFTHARKYALENAILAPTPIYAATIHRIIFENIHLWAGLFVNPANRFVSMTALSASMLIV